MSRILLIDDDPYVLKALAIVLECLGHRAETASSGAEGIGLFERGEFDIVMSDMQMPGMDGIQFLSKVREVDPLAATILVTGHCTLDNLVDAANRGVDAYVTKPLRISQIASAIADVQDRKNLNHGHEANPGWGPKLFSRVKSLVQRPECTTQVPPS